MAMMDIVKFNNLLTFCFFFPETEIISISARTEFDFRVDPIRRWEIAKWRPVSIEYNWTFGWTWRESDRAMQIEKIEIIIFIILFICCLFACFCSDLNWICKGLYSWYRSEADYPVDGVHWADQSDYKRCENQSEAKLWMIQILSIVSCWLIFWNENRLLWKQATLGIRLHN